jgi:peptidoglycan/LPS O-acetylase OafA/YrhL
LALAVLKKEKTGAISRKGSLWTWLGAGGAAVAIGILLFDNNMNDPDQQVSFILINNFILPVPIAVLYYGLITEKTWLSRLLSWKLIGVLGRTSYSFYLVHMLMIQAIAIPFLSQWFNGYYNLYVLVVYFLTQLVALLLFVFFEEPINRLIRRRV